MILDETSTNLPLRGTSSQLLGKASSGYKDSSTLIQASGSVKDIELAGCFLLIYVGGLFLGLYTLMKNEQKPSELNYFFFKNKFICLFLAAFWCAGFSSRWLLSLRSTGSRCAGFSS